MTASLELRKARSRMREPHFVVVALGLIAMLLALAATPERSFADEGTETSDASVALIDPAYEDVSLDAIEPAREGAALTAQDDSYTLALRGTLYQSEARKLLNMVNAERAKKGVAALKWDTEMESTAIQRAFECSLFYSHTRPDGSDTFTAWPSKYRNSTSRSGGENIAAWGANTPYDDVEGAHDAWVDSGGHYATMINAKYKSMGAAFFVDANGLGHWVECFSSLNGNGMGTTAIDGEYWLFVGMKPSVCGGLYAGFGTDDQVILEPGEQLDLGSRAYITPWSSNPERQTYVRCTFVKPEWYPWMSSDSAVASVGQAEGVAGLVTANAFGSTTITMNISDRKGSINVIVGYDMSKAVISAIPDQEYAGKAITPSPTVKLNGKTLRKGTDYTLTYENNVEVSDTYAADYNKAKVTIKGLGNYIGEQTIPFSIVRADISKATVSSIPVQKQTAYKQAMKPEPTVKLNGRTLVYDDDYTFSYRNNTSGGTATLIVRGWGKYTGTKEVPVTITGWTSSSGSGSGSSSGSSGGSGSGSSGGSGSNSGSGGSSGGSSNSGGSATAKTQPTNWIRLAGWEALDTMERIVKTGWNGTTGGTVVLATDAGYWDALTAAGAAGFTGAPVLMTAPSYLSPQTARLLKQMKPKRIIICGGTSVVSTTTANAASKAAGGAVTKRFAGQTMTDTADAVYKGAASYSGGKWSTTAFVATSNGYWDALAAAPVAYKMHMPIFLTQSKTALSANTIKTMKAGGVEKVVIVGGTAVVAKDVETQLEKAGIKVLPRLWGQTAIQTSERVADYGVNCGMSANNMGVATQNGYWDALSGAALCGKLNSVLVLVDKEYSLSIRYFIRNHSGSIKTGYVFGGEFAINPATYKALRAATPAAMKAAEEEDEETNAPAITMLTL